MIWNFIEDQILGMKWLNDFIGYALAKLGLDISGKLGGSIHFFLYDVIKITILLCVLIYMISYIQSYFPPERSKKILGRFKGIGANCIAALLGTVTPFCSCSSIPLFIGFTSAGPPLGVTFSFLISSPMVDLGSLLLLMSIFGTRVAVIYVIVGLMIAIIGGTLIEKLHMENYVEDFILKANVADTESSALTQKDRLLYAKEEVIYTFKKVFPYILAGVAIGAVIHNWIPEKWIEIVFGSQNPFGVVLATLVGIPMYADIFGTIPVAEALLAKGAQLGTILSFMMAVTTLSLPSMIMLKKVAFICVHNSCRSQIAEAPGRHFASDVFESYSASTETKPQINQDAVHIMKKLYGIAMEKIQYSKLISEIPEPDIAISMGCNVSCPFIGRPFDDNWGLEDPTGKTDEEFIKVISQIEKRILQLKRDIRGEYDNDTYRKSK